MTRPQGERLSDGSILLARAVMQAWLDGTTRAAPDQRVREVALSPMSHEHHHGRPRRYPTPMVMGARWLMYRAWRAKQDRHPHHLERIAATLTSVERRRASRTRAALVDPTDRPTT